ncbi:MAG TPA: AAA family ATPase [Acidobacteriaceae bacterium]|nr:AAA family ATPase [Acidobacteriaceae bacterium]
MPIEIPQPDHAIHAVFCVCATPDVATAATEACGELPSVEFVGEFHDYFSPERRPQLSPALKTASVCIAIVDCDRDPEMALSTMERLRSMALKNLSVIAYATQTEASYLLRAMRAGCNEFLTKPADAKNLQEALLRFQNVHLMGTAAAKGNAGRIISFYGAKGGVGTTTLAVHLANNLVRRHRKRTLLIDHQHQLGHVALYFGMKDSQYHFDELVRNADRLDTDLLNGFIVRHSSGLEVLTSPDSCAPDHASNPEELDQVLTFLRLQYDYIIIDSSLSYRDIVAPMLRGSDEICLVTTPDVAALRDLARHIEHFTLTEDMARKLRIIVNRSHSNDPVSAAQIEAVVHHPVWIALPNAYAELMSAINAGEPIAFNHNSKFAQQIGKWASRLVASSAHAELPEAPAEPKKKKFSFFGSKREQVAHGT